MVESGYEIVHADDAPEVSTAEIADVPAEFDPVTLRNVDDDLGTEEMGVKL